MSESEHDSSTSSKNKATNGKRKLGEQDNGVSGGKRQKSNGVAEALSPFKPSSHWVECAYVKWREGESVDELKEERVLVIHVHCSTGVNAGQVAGGGDSKFDLRTVFGMGDFLNREMGVQSAGLNKIENQAKGGAKWLVHMKYDGMGRLAELAELKKLGPGIGIRAYVLPLAKVRSTIKIVVDGWPTWWTEDALKLWIEGESWCKKATECTRIAVEGSPVDKVSTSIHLPDDAVEIEHGKGVDSSDQLYLRPDWKIAADLRGYNLTVHRAASCAFCGDDSHVVLNCEFSQRVNSVAMPTLRSAIPSIPVPSTSMDTSKASGSNAVVKVDAKTAAKADKKKKKQLAKAAGDKSKA